MLLSGPRWRTCLVPRITPLGDIHFPFRETFNRETHTQIHKHTRLFQRRHTEKSQIYNANCKIVEVMDCKEGEIDLKALLFFLVAAALI